MQKAVIFDMDGVLVDSYRPHFESWVDTCAARGFSLTEETFAGLFGRTFDAFVEVLGAAALSTTERDRWYAEKEALYRDLIAEEFPAVDGATDLLHALDAAGVRLAIGSSGPRENVQCVLENLPGAEHFSATVSGDDVTHSKPHPEIFLTAAAALNTAPAQCVVIEDSLAGLEAAERAGMKSIGLTGTAPQAALAARADRVVTSLRQLDPSTLVGASPARR